MLSPLPRRSDWASVSLIPSSRISLPRKGCRVGLRIVLFEACSAFTRVAACTLALSPMRDTLIEGFSHFVSSMTAPIASGWSGCRVGLAPTGKRRLVTAHTQSGHPGAFRYGLPRAGRERKQPRVRREEAYDERCPSGRKASFRHFRRLARRNWITVSLDVLVNLLAQHSTFAKVKA